LFGVIAVSPSTLSEIATNALDKSLWAILCAGATLSSFPSTDPPGGLSHIIWRAIDLECRPHRTSMQCRGRGIKVLGGGHGSSSSYFRLAFDSPQRTCQTINNPVTTRTSSVKVAHPLTSSKRRYSLIVLMILTVLTYNIRRNNSQFTRNGGEALWNNMNARVGNENARPIDPSVVVQAVGPIPGVVPTVATRNQQQAPQGESAPILPIAVPLTPTQGLEDNLGRLLRHNPPWW